MHQQHTFWVALTWPRSMIIRGPLLNSALVSRFLGNTDRCHLALCLIDTATMLNERTRKIPVIGHFNHPVKASSSVIIHELQLVYNSLHITSYPKPVSCAPVKCYT